MAAVLCRPFVERYGNSAGGARAGLRGGRLEVSFATGVSPYERDLLEGGRGQLLADIRAAFQETMAPVSRACVEERTGRRVISQAGSCSIEEQRWRLIFMLAPEERADA